MLCFNMNALARLDETGVVRKIRIFPTLSVLADALLTVRKPQGVLNGPVDSNWI